METAPENSPPPARLDDCWNRIGVRGDRSCPELQAHVHCRNCPVYAGAADRLLDAVPPAGYLDEWTELFARDKAQAGDHDRAVVIFRLGREWLALPAALFREVAPLRTVHTLPHRRDGVVSGIVNVRGELLVCVALDRLLGVEAAGDEAGPMQGKHPRFLVLGRKGERIVFRADEVHGIHRFDPKALQPVPASLGRTATSLTTAMLRWQERSVGCLDEQKLWQTLNRSLA
jgi:chemotaxis-related protein WspD